MDGGAGRGGEGGSRSRKELVASFPVPRPAFCRLQYGTILQADEKLGVGLGPRLYKP